MRSPLSGSSIGRKSSSSAMWSSVASTLSGSNAWLSRNLSRTSRASPDPLLMRSASGEAREALERFRDNHAFDPDKVLATELHIALDEDFLPIEDPLSGERIPRTQTSAIPAYEGTLD